MNVRALCIALAVSACGRASDPIPPAVTPTPAPPPCREEVSGILGGATTWSDGPVCVVGDVFVAPGASLEIAAVEVKFLGRFALVLHQGARLFVTDSILRSAAETPYAGDWGPILADTATEVTVRGSTLSHGSGVQVFQGSLTIEDSEVRWQSGPITANESTIVLRDNVIAEGKCVEAIASAATLERNELASCNGPALLVYADSNTASPLVRHNRFANSTTGLRIGGGIAVSGISRNLFEGNTRGIHVDDTSRFSAHDNHFLDALAIRTDAPGNSDATRNWWGTADPAEIELRIATHPSHPIAFEPFRTSPVPGGGVGP